MLSLWTSVSTFVKWDQKAFLIGMAGCGIQGYGSVLFIAQSEESTNINVVWWEKLKYEQVSTIFLP